MIMITINVRFSLTGGLRDAFTEKNWTQAYDENDNTIKLKYGVKLAKGGFENMKRQTSRYLQKSINFLDQKSKVG